MSEPTHDLEVLAFGDDDFVQAMVDGLTVDRFAAPVGPTEDLETSTTSAE